MATSVPATTSGVPASCNENDENENENENANDSSSASSASSKKQRKWKKLFENLDFSWVDELRPTILFHVERTPLTVLEQKRTGFTWHLRTADPLFSSLQLRNLQIHLDGTLGCKFPIEVSLESKSMSIRHRDVTPAAFVQRLLDQMSDVSLVMLVTRTRLDFDSLKAAHPNVAIYSCRVGHSAPQTDYRLEDVEAVQRFLLRLNKIYLEEHSSNLGYSDEWIQTKFAEQARRIRNSKKEILISSRCKSDS